MEHFVGVELIKIQFQPLQRPVSGYESLPFVTALNDRPILMILKNPHLNILPAPITLCLFHPDLPSELEFL